MFREIALTKGQSTIVDDEDYEWLNQWKWHTAGDPNKAKPVYAARRTSKFGPMRGKVVMMHNIILPPRMGLRADHINRNGLDNQRANLRYATVRQNNNNIARRHNGESRFKGVTRGKISGTWRANIYKDGQQTNLGFFDSEKAAAWAYNVAAQENYGEYAFLNDVSKDCALPRRRPHRKGKMGAGRIGIPWFHVHYSDRLQKWQLQIKDPRAQDWYRRTRIFNSLEEAREFARGIYDEIIMAPSG